MMKSEKFCAKQKQSKNGKKKNKNIIPVHQASNYGLRFVALLLIVLIASPAVFKAGRTQAYFIDLAEPVTVTSTAGTLLFVASGSDFSPGVTPTVNSTRTIDLQNTGSLDFIYQVRTANISTSTLCDALELKDDISAVFTSLTSFTSATSAVSVLPSVVLEARLATSSQSLSGQACQFDLILTAWQTNFSDATLGFSHTQTISSTIIAGDWQETPPPSHTVVAGDVVINEVEYDTPQSGNDKDYEWFELYNNTSLPITLSGWTITDNGATDTIPDLTIASKGFAVVSASSTGFATNYPGFSGTIVYILDGIIGNGLSNTSDRLILKRADGAEIDAVSWLNDDYAFGVGNGVTPATGAGHSIARKIKGVDTNLPDDWEKLNNPNPGTNPHLIIGEEFAVLTEEMEDSATTTEETVPENIPPDDQPSEAPTDDLLPAVTNKVLDLTPITPVPDVAGGE